MRSRIRCRAVLLDAGGVIVLPDRHVIANALARAGIDIDPGALPRAHYRAVRALDRAAARVATPAGVIRPDATPVGATTASDDYASATSAGATPASAATASDDYAAALLPQLGIVPGHAAEALAIWDQLGDRHRSGEVLWREPTPDAASTIAALERAGIAVVVVTNSDGHAEENLAACGFGGVPVVDSMVVGAAKPDPRIFEVALARACSTPAETVHVGDSLVSDVAGARAAGIAPIHFDPLRTCRARDHRHVRSLVGIWRHIACS